MIEHDELCSLIPHAGDMCLLDRVVSWDENTILCESTSHQAENNPLRRQGRLSSIHLLEYGAQAMAVHGGLLARQQGKKLAGGYLAALRDVSLTITDLRECQDAMQVEAEKVFAQAGNLIYNFKITAAGECMAEGRATVIETGNE